ncbi:putative uncharacterized protein DDB_G0282133 [Daktulosphaira vitifoliae]|uniref:putative uncharacterized protein DDB_G0282133 n=1 Tax=Daktulosphaira vitifoliae TaxID=58002 RepID=UPI0021AA92ED|nr:putative uncharacterized protein DDB_G0282133 [Daktulosphaira vitifoliae]XP_050521111.1 putative uncharacterized protein DDB_G0282133 [Daktulosphaira vitifoliae]
MTSRQSVSSILKPPKIRPPLKEIEPVEQDGDENTASLPKRKVSFSGMNKIKMYNTAATSLTVCQAPMYDEQFSMLSDSSNTEKSKTPGKFEKSDTYTTFEPSNCTNVENNCRVIIEYDSPNDNMEITEALSGKIISKEDTIYTFENNESLDNKLDFDSSDNMEFTEAVKGCQILIANNRTIFETAEVSLPLNDESKNQVDDEPSNEFCNMDMTCGNIQSSNMEFTCMNNQTNDNQVINSKSFTTDYSLNNSKSSCMELTKMHSGQIYKEKSVLYNEYSSHSMSIEAELSNEILSSSTHNTQITEKSSENLIFNNNQNQENFYKGDTDDTEEINKQLSADLVSMDIGEEFKNDENNYINANSSEKVKNNLSSKDDEYESQNEPSTSPIVEENVPQSRKSRKSIAPVSLLNIDNNTSLNEENNEIKQKKYSRKSMAIKQSHTPIEFEEHDEKYETVSFEKVIENNQVNVNNSIENSNEKNEVDDNVMVNDQELNLSHSSKLSESSLPDSSMMNIQDNVDINYEKSIVLDEKSCHENLRNIIIESGVDIENEQKKVYRKSLAPMVINNINSQPLNSIDHCCKELLINNDFKNIIVDDNDLNSPFRKKSKKSIQANTSGIDNNLFEKSTNLFSQDVLEDKKSCNMNMSVEHTAENELVDQSHASMCSSHNTSMIKQLMSCSSLNDEEHFLSLLKSSSKQKPCSKDQSFEKESSFSQRINNILKEADELEAKEGYENDYNDSRLDEIIGECNVSDVKMDNFVKQTEKTINDSSIHEKKSLETSTATNLEENCRKKSVDHNPHDILVAEISNICSQNSDSSISMNRKRCHSNRECTPLSNSFNSRHEVAKSENSLYKINTQESFCISDEITNNVSVVNIDSDNVSYNENKILLNNKQIIDDVQKKDITYEIEQNEKLHSNDGSINNTSINQNSLSQEINEYLSEDMSIKNNCINETVKENSYDKKSEDDQMDVSINESTNNVFIYNNQTCQDISINEEPTTECLADEVTEFLTKWKNSFIDKLLVLEKCTNTKWIFNLLNNNLYLEINYSFTVDNHSFLKVEDISFSASSTDDEIMKFGINWISTKYNPKMYKRICFTIGHVELLLKSLLEDVKFIHNVMNSMLFLHEVYCVKYKNNKASFVLHRMTAPMMACIEICLTNIHKICIKDISVDCIFGSFDNRVLSDIVENTPKDSNILQSIVEKLKTVSKNNKN